MLPLKREGDIPSYQQSYFFPDSWCWSERIRDKITGHITRPLAPFFMIGRLRVNRTKSLFL